MKTVLQDGRVFETLPFAKIIYEPEEMVYKYTFKTSDRTVKSSSRHEFIVWDTKAKELILKKMEDIKIDDDELLIQGWED